MTAADAFTISFVLVVLGDDEDGDYKDAPYVHVHGIC